MLHPWRLPSVGSAAAFGTLVLGGLTPTAAVGQDLREGVPPDTVGAVVAAIDYMRAEERLRGPLRLGIPEDSPAGTPAGTPAGAPEWLEAVATRVGIPLDTSDAFQQAVCDEEGRAEAGGDGCRWVNPGNPVQVEILPLLEGQSGLRIAMSVRGMWSGRMSTERGERMGGWGHHFDLLVTPSEDGTHEVEILNVLHATFGN